MAEEAEEEAKAANTFSNDGSFMEQFMKMQKEKEEESETNSADKKDGAKLGASAKPVARKPPTSLAQKMMMKRAAKKLAAASSGDGGDGGNSGGKEGMGEGGTQSKDGPEPSATPSSTLSTDAQMGGASPSSATPTSQTAPTGTKGGRKRKSKWDVGSSEPTMDSHAIHEAIGSFVSGPSPSLGAAATAGPSGGSQQLSADQLEQLREQIAMQKMVAEIKAATASQSGSGPSAKQNRYEYDSDEEVDGGTWEHKARIKEMRLTERKAEELTEMGKGKHHIGDFLPSEELEKFVETVKAVKEDREPDFSDYKEHKLTEENIGFQLLQKAGWDEGTGLGAQQQGITAPVNKGKQSFDQSGVGAVKPAEVKKCDDEFDLYRKRMMLAYRFRPNPLNNPRRPYY